MAEQKDGSQPRRYGGFLESEVFVDFFLLQ